MFTGKLAPGKKCACMSENVIYAEFHDKSFNGVICMKHLWKMIEACVEDESNNKPKEKEATPAQTPNPKTEAKPVKS